jgi:membrane protein DedA with SNARE-associated domain
MMQSIIDAVVQWATALIGDWGLPAVFFLMLLESACIPVPSEAIMPFAGFAVSEGDMTLLGITVAGVAGNVVGSWIAYWVGLYGGRPFIDKWGKFVLLRHHHVELAERWFEKYGPIAVFFSRVLPIVRTFISLPAGIAKMPFLKFLAYSAVGSVIWNAALAYLGYGFRKALGDDGWDRLQEVFHEYNLYFYIALAVFALAVVGWGYWRWRKRKNLREDAPPADAPSTAEVTGESPES